MGSYSSYDDDEMGLFGWVLVLLIMAGVIFGIYQCATYESQATKDTKAYVSKCYAQGNFNRHYCELKYKCLKYQKEDKCNAKLVSLYTGEMSELVKQTQEILTTKINKKPKELEDYAREYAKQNGIRCILWDDDEDKCGSTGPMPSIAQISSDLDQEATELKITIGKYQSAILHCKDELMCNTHLE